MSKIVFYLFVLLGTFSFSQDNNNLDHTVRNYPKYESLEELTLKIQHDFKNSEDQIRAAFVWVTHNISYHQSQSEVFEPREKFVHYSEFGKQYQIRKNELQRIEQALKTKRGVCVEFSLLLHEICSLLGFPTQRISGIAKTTIEKASLEQLYKNHTWNAVYINGTWQLMDATWGAGYWDWKKDIFVKKFQEHYFFTTPSDFIKDHFPGKKQWQLMENAVTVEKFMESPIFYLDYFLKKVDLIADTRGIWEVAKNQELQFTFTKLPKRYSLEYSLGGFHYRKRVRVRRLHKNSYRSKLKLRKQLKSDTYLTLYLENKPILNFKLQPKTY